MNNFDKMVEMQKQYLEMQNQHAQRMHEAFMMMGDLAKIEASKTQGFVPYNGLPQQPVSPSPAPQPMVQQQPQCQQLPPVLDIQEPRAPEPVKDQGSGYKTRIKAIKPCKTCKLSSKYNGGNCTKDEGHFLTPDCPAETWRQKKAAMNASGKLVIKMADQGEDGVYQNGVFIGIHPKNKNTRDMRTMLEENFLGQDVGVYTTIDRKNPDSIYTNVFMDVVGSVASTPVEQEEPVIVPDVNDSLVVPDGPLNLGFIEEDEELPV